MKILCTAILKDDSELPEVERMLASFMPYMSGLAVAITGLSAPEGTKKLAQLIKKYKGEYIITSPATHPEIYLKDDKGFYFSSFAAARNVVFKLAYEMHAKNKYDWFTWADADDVLQSGAELKNIAAQAVGGDWVHFPYWYAVQQDKDGNIRNLMVEHSRERLLNPNIPWKWISRLHEICLPVDSNYQPKGVKVEYNPVEGGTKTVWIHLPPKDHYVPNLARNIQILETQVREEQHKDPRTLFYLAKCYIDLSEQNQDQSLLQLAQLLLEEYMTLSGWAEERSFACQYLGMVAMKLDHFEEAIQYYQQAINEYPISHLPYLWLAHLYMTKNMDEVADHWLDVVINMPPPTTRTTIGTPLEIKTLYCKLKYNQAMKKMNIPEAITYKKRQNELEMVEDKDDDVLTQLYDIKENNDAAQWMHNYAVFLKKKGYKEQLKALLSAMSPDWQNEYFAQKLAKEVLEPRVWPKKSIAYVCATPFAPFNPQTAMQDGIGGSETAVIRLSEEWAKEYQVTVYANVTADMEVNGVTYKHWNQWNPRDTFDILIFWRNVTLVDGDMKARKVFIDLHDLISQLDFTPERLAKIDKVFVKSNFHRSMIPNVADEKVKVISNGIDV